MKKGPELTKAADISLYFSILEHCCFFPHLLQQPPILGTTSRMWRPPLSQEGDTEE